MQANDQNRRMYLNTMIFTVVAVISIVCLIVIALISPQFTRKIRPILLTVIIGLLFVTVYSVVRIWMYESNVTDLLNNSQSSLLSADTCPDYFTSNLNADGEVVCVNEYKAPRSDHTFKFVGKGGRVVRDTINMKEFKRIKAKDLCAKVDPTTDKPIHNIPWTDVRAKCSSLTNG